MTLKEHIKYWFDSAEFDLRASEKLLNTDYFVWSLFISNLSLEKILKAIYVQITNNQVPPKIHNLLKLA